MAVLVPPHRTVATTKLNRIYENSWELLKPYTNVGQWCSITNHSGLDLVGDFRAYEKMLTFQTTFFRAFLIVAIPE